MGRVRTTKQMTGRDREYQVDGISNRIFSNTDQNFKNACDAAGVKPTRRQASKFRKGYGLAFTKGIH